MLNIIIGQLPPDVTEEKLRQQLSPLVEVKDISITHEGDPNRAAAVVTVNTSRAAAEVVVRYINASSFEGRRLRAHLPSPFAG